LRDHLEEPTAIRTQFGAIFVSLELSRKTWLITSLSPGNGEKMSKRGVAGGDVAALLGRFAELKRKATARTEKTFPIIVIQEAGLDGFWLHRVLEGEGIESQCGRSGLDRRAAPAAAGCVSACKNDPLRGVIGVQN
jgi:transposase